MHALSVFSCKCVELVSTSGQLISTKHTQQQCHSYIYMFGHISKSLREITNCVTAQRSPSEGTGLFLIPLHVPQPHHCFNEKVNDNLPSLGISNLSWCCSGSQLLLKATAALSSPTGRRNSSFRQGQRGKSDELANFLTYSILLYHVHSASFPACWEEVYC